MEKPRIVLRSYGFAVEVNEEFENWCELDRFLDEIRYPLGRPNPEDSDGRKNRSADMHRAHMLLHKWLNAHIDHVSSKWGISKGEAMRFYLCWGVLCQDAQFFGKSKKMLALEITLRDLCLADKFDQDKLKDFLEDVFYETRKRIEASIWT